MDALSNIQTEIDMSHKLWRQLASDIEEIKEDAQHHEHVQAVKWNRIEATAEVLIANGTSCPQHLAAHSSYTFLDNYVKK